jgi:diketogulonate reductase-like aldo/keto reductase
MAPYDTDAPLELQVRQSVESSLHNFTIQGHGPPYIDCLILHVPLETHDDMMTVWKTLESYVPDKVRHLGISNVTLNGLRVLMMSVNIKPAVVQNPWCRQTGYAIELREFCMEQGIIFQAFWTLSANHHLARGEHVRKLADSAGVSHPSAYYSLVLGLGNISILDGTTSEQHMKEDLAGIEKVGAYADGSGRTAWLEAQTNFKRAVRY